MTTVFDGARATVRHLRKSKLTVVKGADKGSELEIGKSRVSVGRSIINDLVLNDRAVSGTHFEILCDEDGYRLRDLDSKNGTFVGEMRVRDVYLGDGTTVRAGHSEMRFQPLREVVEIALSESDRFDHVLGSSVKMREMFATLEKVAPSDLTVLISGETGTGKEVVARAIHARSPRQDRPFVVLDCSAIPRDLMESTVFGHEKGSFTGAVSQHKGVFEQAQGGTIFLDEIGELDMALQPKLLRVLEAREIKRVGGDRSIKVDVRVLAASNRDLRQMVNQGRFREDLYFRLSVIVAELPPLRDRRDDIPLLVHHFLDGVGERLGRRVTIGVEAMSALVSHDYPGNVRELRNVVERAASLCDGDTITIGDLDFATTAAPSAAGAGYGVGPLPAGLTFKEAKQQVVDAFERQYLRDLLRRHRGNITRAAQDAGLTRFHMREILKRHAMAGGAAEAEA